MMLATTPYPFKHGNEQATVGHYAVELIPDKRDIDAILGQTDRTLSRLFELSNRGAARLVWMAEKVEAALGLPPIGHEKVEAHVVQVPVASPV
jgi:hypothetical protein